jgi:hypothetical protein
MGIPMPKLLLYAVTPIPLSTTATELQASKVIYNKEMYFDAAVIILYFTEFYLTSDTDRQQDITLTCQTLDGTMQHHSFPVAEVGLALKNYFYFFQRG